MAPTRALLVLLCAVYAWGTLVPNEYVKTKDGKSTSIVTGIYYSLFNYGQIEKQRGGLITFYVNDDPDNQGIHDDLTYKTLALDYGHKLNPGGRNYEATLFALKRIQGNTYQLWNKKLQGPVTYKKLNADEFTLVIHGVESNMHQQLKKPGKLFNTTLFTLTKVNDLPNYYQLESADLNAVIDYNGNVPSFPRDLLINRNSKEAKQNPKNNTSRQGSYFRFNLADFYKVSIGERKYNADKRIKASSIDIKQSKVIFKATNSIPSGTDTYKLSYAEKITNQYTIKEEELVQFPEINAQFKIAGKETSKVGDEKTSQLEYVTLHRIELDVGVQISKITDKITSNSSDFQVSVDTKIEVKQDFIVTVILDVYGEAGDQKLDMETKMLARGRRLTNDGLESEDTDLDADAIMEMCKEHAIGQKLTRSNGIVSLFATITVKYLRYFNYTITIDSSRFNH